MGLSCGAKLAKIILFIFNFVFFLLGAALLGIGIWITVDKSSLVKLANTALDSADNAVSNTLTSTSSVQIGAYVLIGVGAFTFLVGFCGCCGACTENKCMLGIFAALIIVVIIIEIVGAVLAGVYRNKIEAKLTKGLTNLLNKKYIGWPMSLGDNEAISLAWDSTMVTIGCCGLNGPSDFAMKDGKVVADKWYTNGRYYSLSGKNYTKNEVKLPVACCKFTGKDFMGNGWKAAEVQKSMKNNRCPLDNKDYEDKGCVDAIKSLVQKHATILIGIVAGIICFEILVIIVAICLLRAIGDSQSDYEQAATA